MCKVCADVEQNYASARDASVNRAWSVVAYNFSENKKKLDDFQCHSSTGNKQSMSKLTSDKIRSKSVEHSGSSIHYFQ